MKQTHNLTLRAREALRLLVEDLRTYGPFPGKGWPHYGKLTAQKRQSKEDRRHCHLTRGKPTYVCCWVVLDSQLKHIEVYYVGTHEKAPY